jgi:peptide/nickel transport system permease protein
MATLVSPGIDTPVNYSASPGLWTLGWRRLRTDHVGMISLAIVIAFVLQMILSGTGLVAGDWSKEVGTNYAPPTFVGAPPAEAPAAPGAESATPQPGSESAGSESTVVDPLADEMKEIMGKKASANAYPVPGPDGKIDGVTDPLAQEMAEIRAETKAAEGVVERRATLPFGADKWGRDVLKKTIKGSETSIFVGIAAAFVATLLGTLFGALAGFFGRWMDDAFNWFYSVFTSIPYLLLILSVAAVVPRGKGLLSIVLILGLTGWTGIFRLVRAEYLKHKSREYVQAADAIGASNSRRMFVHILPNVSHVVLVQLSQHVVSFIKAEVILSFLGFGVPVDVVSWGSMLNEAQNELILGYWWQLAAAGTAMAVLVTGFSMLTDALRDALDPKLK